jgi:hypothetical protein
VTGQQDGARRLVKAITATDGFHHLGTLNAAKVQVLELIHELPEPVTVDQLAEASGWTSNYVYRLADELAHAGILIASPALGARTGGQRRSYRCSCSTTQEGNRS